MHYILALLSDKANEARYIGGRKGERQKENAERRERGEQRRCRKGEKGKKGEDKGGIRGKEVESKQLVCLKYLK